MTPEVTTTTWRSEATGLRLYSASIEVDGVRYTTAGYSTPEAARAAIAEVVAALPEGKGGCCE